MYNSMYFHMRVLGASMGVYVYICLFVCMCICVRQWAFAGGAHECQKGIESDCVFVVCKWSNAFATTGENGLNANILNMRLDRLEFHNVWLVKGYIPDNIGLGKRSQRSEPLGSTWGEKNIRRLDSILRVKVGRRNCSKAGDIFAKHKVRSHCDQEFGWPCSNCQLRAGLVQIVDLEAVFQMWWKKWLEPRFQVRTNNFAESALHFIKNL